MSRKNKIIFGNKLLKEKKFKLNFDNKFKP